MAKKKSLPSSSKKANLVQKPLLKKEKKKEKRPPKRKPSSSTKSTPTRTSSQPLIKKPTVKAQESPREPSSQEKRSMDNMSKTILQFITGKRYRPMKTPELLERLQIPSQLWSLCSKIIANLITTGKIDLDQDEFIRDKKEEEETLTGILRMHPKGFGFVIPDDPSQSPQDIFIPKHLSDSAVDGDHVEVALNLQSLSDKGPEGRIIGVLKRARTRLAGTIRQVTSHAEITAYVPILGNSKPVTVFTEAEDTLKIGDRVILNVLKWGTEKESTTCQLVDVIGNIADPSFDISAAVEEFDLRSTFAKPIVDEAKAYGKKVSTKELKKRVDFSKEECFTIDPDTAKDFDDALTLKKDRKGHYHLGVHIADVAHYVPPHSALDKEAKQRANSTYFPGHCIPMLPEELSNELCSLKPKELRLTVSVCMEFDKQGTLLKQEIVRSYIKSKKRFTYFEAKDILDGHKKSRHAKTLKEMRDLCLLLKKKRYERGSIDFSLPEIVIVIDEKGEPQGIKKIEYDITHQLVEEFMLKANEAVAVELTSRGKSLIYRVHEMPQEENLKDFLQFARILGFKTPLKPSLNDLQLLFEEAKKTSFLSQLSIAFIRNMRLAQYSSKNIGHFGLSLEHYCHFTSPIRRYSDLIIQRLLFNEESEETNLEAIAQHCSEQERVSFRAEASVKTLKKLRLLQKYFDENPDRQYPALVTKIKHFGLFFELQDLMFEGFLHISELENDYFLFDEKRNLLVGKHSGRMYQIGKQIQVSLSRIDLILLESRWMLHSDFSRPRSSSMRRKKKRIV